MSARFNGWSYSTLTAFETCPKRHYHTRVAKDIYDPPGEAAAWGDVVHKSIEKRLTSGAQLPTGIQRYEPIVEALADYPGTRIVEYKMAITSSMKPSGWTTPGTWCRGIVDFGIVAPQTAVLIDWKTGKRKPESDQLKLFAGLAFAHFPNVEVVKTAFVWLKEEAVDKDEFRRDQTTEIWQEFAPRVQRMERAYKDEKFPPKPSGLCRKHCPVPQRLCQYSGKV
jgi:hypothetical protein